MSDTSETEPGRIINEPMSEALSKRYLAYALSTITARALPDVRDGLKPVQRRILYAMRELRLNPDAAYRKCAKIVGEVMGNYHPHGDSAIYDTLVRLAQDFSVRYPLVDGQGNFGNVDGDAAAAMRYTESRMTDAAKLLLEGLDEDAVDFRDTYDELNNEPVVLPAGFPNLLANGATGIAVGMATSIPPHNVAEVIDAALKLIDKPEASTAALLKIMPGPDFPTGGVIVEPRDAILEAYETGRGGFRVRARWHVEDQGRGQYNIVVTEVPYQVQKSKLIERLAELIETKKAPLLADVRDESAEDVRIVLEPRARTVEAPVLMESLFKLSDLETRFSLNMNVLHEGAPQVMGLRDVLRAYLDHRRDVALRRARFRLGKIEDRLHILDGYLVAYLNIDEVIRIIREEDEPKAVMMERFGITDVQAEAVLNLRLRALRKLEEMEIRGEHEKLQAERKTLKALIGSEELQWSKVAEELRAARAVFDPETELGRRRAGFEDAPEIDMEAALEASTPKEPLTVVLSEKGWIRAIKGHVADVSTVKFKEGDSLFRSEQVMSTDKIILMAGDGRAFMLSADKLPGGRGHGEPIRLSIELEDSVDIVAMFRFDEDRKRIVASDAGYGFVLPESELFSTRKAGKQVVSVPSDSELIVCEPVVGDHIAVIGTNKKMLVFPLSDLPEMPRGKGVKLQAYRGADKLADAIGFFAEAGLIVREPNGRQRAVPDWEKWIGRRTQAGRLAPRGFPRSGRFNG
ncbi:MAG: DNA topoisomerase IV subunit A [Pseudomonadota bacterium]